MNASWRLIAGVVAGVAATGALAAVLVASSPDEGGEATEVLGLEQQRGDETARPAEPTESPTPTAPETASETASPSPTPTASPSPSEPDDPATTSSPSPEPSPSPPEPSPPPPPPPPSPEPSPSPQPSPSPSPSPEPAPSPSPTAEPGPDVAAAGTYPGGSAVAGENPGDWSELAVAQRVERDKDGSYRVIPPLSGSLDVTDVPSDDEQRRARGRCGAGAAAGSEPLVVDGEVIVRLFHEDVLVAEVAQAVSMTVDPDQRVELGVAASVQVPVQEGDEIRCEVVLER